jgi:small subunit ribosomal protein S8
MENSIIDLIIRIKNSYFAGQEALVSPYSRFKEEVLKKLVELGFVKNYEIEGEKIKSLIIKLVYNDKGQAALRGVKLFSRPSRRVYVSYKELKPVMSGIGYAIISTPKGLMTNKEAKKAKVGGELLFHIW